MATLAGRSNGSAHTIEGTKMAETTSTQATGPFKKAAGEQLERLGQVMDEAAKLQAQWVEQSLQSVDGAGELFKAAVKYWVDLSAEARKLTLEAGRRALEMVP